MAELVDATLGKRFGTRGLAIHPWESKSYRFESCLSRKLIHTQMKRIHNKALRVMTNDSHAPKSKLHGGELAAGIIYLIAFTLGLAFVISQITSA